MNRPVVEYVLSKYPLSVPDNKALVDEILELIANHGDDRYWDGRNDGWIDGMESCCGR